MPRAASTAALVLYLNKRFESSSSARFAAALVGGALSPPYRRRSQAPGTRRKTDFLRGVAWLHSFGYEDAIDAFRAAQKIDPSFAMAYWGEAMSFSQPLWFYEEVARAAPRWRSWGRHAAARMAKARTPREQGFMRAVEALFGPGDKPRAPRRTPQVDGEGRR